MNPDVLARLYPGSPKKDAPSRISIGAHTSPQNQQSFSPQRSTSYSHESNVSPDRCAPVFAPEYLAELRSRQQSQLASIAAYLDSDSRPQIGVVSGRGASSGGGVYGNCVGHLWTFGPSFSRTLESLEPDCGSFPPTARSLSRLASARSASQRAQTQQQSARPFSAATSEGARKQSPSQQRSPRSSNGITGQRRRNHILDGQQPTLPVMADDSQSLFTVVRAMPANISPRAAVPSVQFAVNQTHDQRQSGRPLPFEYQYRTRAKPLQPHEMLSKSDAAIIKHQKRTLKLELQREKLRNATPMAFSWQV